MRTDPKIPSPARQARFDAFNARCMKLFEQFITYGFVDRGDAARLFNVRKSQVHLVIPVERPASGMTLTWQNNLGRLTHWLAKHKPRMLTVLEATIAIQAMRESQVQPTKSKFRAVPGSNVRVLIDGEEIKLGDYYSQHYK